MRGARKGKSREIIKTHVASDEMYRYYNSILGDVEKKNGFKVPKRTYTKILKEFNKWISNKIIYNPKGVVLPYKLGRLQIMKYKTPLIIKKDGTLFKKHIPVNWNETLALWDRDEDAKNKKMLVRQLNDHTDGYTYEWKWNKSCSNVTNHKVYFFKPTRTNKLLLKKELTKEEIEVDYYELIKYKKQC